MREECLDRLFILGEGHLRRVLQKCVDYYHGGRSHQAINQPTGAVGEVRCWGVLAGLIHDYYRAAA